MIQLYKSDAPSSEFWMRRLIVGPIQFSVVSNGWVAKLSPMRFSLKFDHTGYGFAAIIIRVGRYFLNIDWVP